MNKITPIFVVFVNDTPIQATQTYQGAQRLIARKAAQDYVKMFRRGHHWSYEEYRNVLYWHIHEVLLIEEAAK